MINNDRGFVTPINTASNKASKQIKVGGLPNALAITPNGKTLYVVSSSPSGWVTPINTATNKAGKRISVGKPRMPSRLCRSSRDRWPYLPAVLHQVN